MAAVTFESLMKDLDQGRVAPVYLLHGKEGFYLDALIKKFETLLPEADRDFNQYIFYGSQDEPQRIIDTCRSIPMMVDKQLVIVKEAQAARADKINRLHTYVRNPQPQTILVICFRGDAAKGKDLLAAAKANAVIFESKELRDYNIIPAMERYIQQKGMSVNYKALEMLRDFIGCDMSRVANEVDKLSEILGPGASITPEAIERYIGISKDFNHFELIEAISARNAAMAFRIANYFASNPKAAAMPQVTASIFGYFADLLVAFYAPDKSEAALMKALKLSIKPAVQKYRRGLSNYNAFQVIEILDAIRTFAEQSRGIGSRQNEHDLFRQLLFTIFTASGRLPV